MTDNFNDNNDIVNIKHLNPHNFYDEKEKMAIKAFRLERSILNTKQSNDEKLNYLDETFKEKLKKLKTVKSKSNVELPKINNNIKSETFRKTNNILDSMSLKKVINIEELKLFQRKSFFKKKDFNINSIGFSNNLKYFNKLALKNVCPKGKQTIRKYYKVKDSVKKFHLNKTNYNKYKNNLNQYAVNKMYYMFAPKKSSAFIMYKLCLGISAIIIVFSLFILLNWFIQGQQINNLNKSLKEKMVIQNIIGGEIYNMKEPGNLNTDIDYNDYNDNVYWKYVNTPLSSVNFDDLKAINKDTVGWLIVNNTNINYPFVQTNNNDYYLTHSFDKSRNNAGWVFADYRNDFSNLDFNTVIYAHGRKDKVMFGSLTNALEPSWYTNLDNQLIQLSTLNFNSLWQVFSVYKIEAESYYITTSFSTNEIKESFIKMMKQRSIYDFGIDVNANDKILTLSTCYNNNGIRMVVQAKLVKIQERTS